MCCRLRADEDRRGVQGDTGAGDEYREYLCPFFFIIFLVFRICRRCCWKFNRKIFWDNIFVPLTWPVFCSLFFFFFGGEGGECNRILLSREVATLRESLRSVERRVLEIILVEIIPIDGY